MNEMDQPALVLATTNSGKLAELRALLPEGVGVASLAEIGLPAPEETGSTHAENARIKALAAAAATGTLALADDSGLAVAALGGAPGVHSARFAGSHASDDANRAALLAALSSTKEDERAARFHCVVVLARPGLVLAEAHGRCEGRIAHAPSGRYGFGYDPLFVLPDGRRMAELPSAEKNRISHRALAYRRLRPVLLHQLDARPRARSVR